MYIVVVVLVGLGAVNSQNNMLFFAFGLALAAALISGVVSGGTLLSLEVERIAPRVGAVGAPLHVGYSVRNRSRWLPAFAIALQEAPARGRREESAGRAQAPPARAFVAQVGTRSRTRVDSIVVPTRRGTLTFGSVRASTSFPLGITRKSVTFAVDEGESGPARCIIRPEIVPIASEAVRRAAAMSNEGERSSPSVGLGDEFYSIREYAPGDSARQIAWRPSARTGTLLVRENASRAPMRLWIGLALAAPTGADDDAARLNERAISLAASLIARASEDGAEVGLSAPACAVVAPPRAGARHAERLLDMLAVLDVEHADMAQGGAFPPSQRSAAWLIVHATERRPARVPARAALISAARPDSILAVERLEGSPTWR